MPGRKRAPRGDVVIVESPAKAKTIERYLGPGFRVLASYGHVRDLPKRRLGVDVEHDFAPRYEPLGERRRELDRLTSEARDADQVWLATDLDREGESIAWHIAEHAELPADRIRRVTFSEITKSAIDEAFAHPRGLNLDLVNAQQARRIIDRLVGYKLSPLVASKIRRGLSAGRVQSVAVRLVVEREREIAAFTP
ncbi:MAG TPA: toprim domain-containing protein, partial [Candidatus Limnocylindria bacterium]|nr:toprim domain-containing protein [Candidatus Limnocylindria bacterium]